MNPPPPQQRLRITYGKDGSLVYVGHLDLARIWERVLRRAALPLAYSHGFNPRPRIQLADALPLGISSACELIDIWMKESVPTAGLAEQLQAVAPAGLVVHAVEAVDRKSPALQTLIDAADYLITFDGAEAVADLEVRVAHFLAQPHIERERRGKTYDLRPLVRKLAVTPAGALEATLSLGQAGTGRPDELLDALGLTDTPVTIHRQRLYLRA